jgi:hypothetical protein
VNLEVLRQAGHAFLVSKVCLSKSLAIWWYTLEEKVLERIAALEVLCWFDDANRSRDLMV